MLERYTKRGVFGFHLHLGIRFLWITSHSQGPRTGGWLDNCLIAMRTGAGCMELDYFVVDVFADTAFKGNPLAVVMNTCNLTADQMQAIAREFNLSETTFVERRDAGVEKREGVLVRIFTTPEALPFAGHQR